MTIPSISRLRFGSFLLPWLPFALPPLAWYAGQVSGAPEGWAWMPMLVMFGLIPVMDLWLGQDFTNPAAGPNAEDRSAAAFFRLIPILCLPAYLLLLLWGAHLFAKAGWDWHGQLGWLLSIGTIGGAIAITAAHELIHKPSRFEQGCGGFLLSLLCYPSFKVEHILGHHVWVATPLDPSTARLNQSLYHFLPRTMIGNVRNGWRLQKVRLQRRRRRAFSLANELLGWYALTLLLLAGFTIAWGWLGMLFFLGQALWAVILLESVNYIEHYGLRRHQLPNGRYEKVTPMHSWNSSLLFSNRVLFQLQRHSDHHANGARRFQSLRHHNEAPQLPAGYATLIPLAMIPPLWRRVIHPRLKAFQHREPALRDRA